MWAGCGVAIVPLQCCSRALQQGGITGQDLRVASVVQNDERGHSCAKGGRQTQNRGRPVSINTMCEVQRTAAAPYTVEGGGGRRTFPLEPIWPPNADAHTLGAQVKITTTISIISRGKQLERAAPLLLAAMAIVQSAFRARRARVLPNQVNNIRDELAYGTHRFCANKSVTFSGPAMGIRVVDDVDARSLKNADER